MNIQTSTKTPANTFKILKTGQAVCYDETDNPVTCNQTHRGQDARENQGIDRNFSNPTQHSIYISDYETIS